MIRYTNEFLEAAYEGGWLDARREAALRGTRPRAIRVFESGVLELMSRAHPITPGVWFFPYVIWALATSPARLGAVSTAALFGAGVLVFSLFEYGLHRVVFHGLIHRAMRHRRARFAAFIAHGYHHEYPNDPLRLVMPPMISWPLAALFALAYWALLGSARYAPMLAGTMVGYVAYDWVHYYVHHAKPTFRLGKWLRTYHLRHHFQDHDAFFGISSPLWDVVFRTHRSAGR